MTICIIHIDTNNLFIHPMVCIMDTCRYLIITITRFEIKILKTAFCKVKYIRCKNHK